MKFIELTQGLSAALDDDDYEFLNQWKWYAKKSGSNIYAARNNYTAKGNFTLRMHRVLLNLPPGQIPEVDFIDGNTLNLQRSNLRICNRQQNGCNRGKTRVSTSGAKGVFFHKRSNKWVAQVKHRQKLYNLGSFDAIEDAKAAYDKKAQELHGEFYHE